jgi:hypothetical protein
MKGQRFSANEHGWSENRFVTEEARKIISLLGKSDSDRSPFLLSWPERSREFVIYWMTNQDRVFGGLELVCHPLDDKPTAGRRSVPSLTPKGHAAGARWINSKPDFAPVPVRRHSPRFQLSRQPLHFRQCRFPKILCMA